jgi:hypothetical protein
MSRRPSVAETRILQLFCHNCGLGRQKDAIIAFFADRDATNQSAKAQRLGKQAGQQVN